MNDPRTPPQDLSAGRRVLSIPGPSVVPDRILRRMHRASPNIYAGELVSLTHSLIPDLKALAGTRHNVAIYISNGHGAWEAALANTIRPGDRVLALSTGVFGAGWADVARALGARVEVLEVGASESWDLAQISAHLAADKAGEIRAVLATHVDTSTSVRNDIAALREVMKTCGPGGGAHPALLMADCIASMGCERFEMDAFGVDVAVAASQKGLMMPPGLSFVWFGARAAARRSELEVVSPYWDWVPRSAPDGFYQYFNGTAPTHHLFGLRESLDMLLHEQGRVSTWGRHAQLARAVWAACEAWGQGGSLRMNIAAPELRSHAVTALHIDSPAGTALRDHLEAHFGVTLGIGLGQAAPGDPAWHGYFRIGHMGHVNAHMVLGTLAAMDAGMKALGIAHGGGALEAAAAVCAG